MIAHRASQVTLKDEAVNEAIALFTTPMANLDPEEDPERQDKTTVVQDIEAWLAQDPSSRTGRPPQPNSIRYTVLALLVALHVLIRTARPVSYANALDVLLFETTPAQRQALGMTSDLSRTRAPVIAAGLQPDASRAVKRRSRNARNQEYARLAKSASGLLSTFDPSPFPRNRQLSNALWHSIRRNFGHAQRRIGKDEQDRNQERLERIANKIVAASALDAPLDAPLGQYAGDLLTDETLFIAWKVKRGRGLKPHHKRPIDPDTGWWPGKGNKSDEPGFGYGVTLVIRMGRPYQRRVREVAIGIHVHVPTGGSVAAFKIALRHAKRHGLTRRGQRSVVVADMAYISKNDWVPTLLAEGYRVVTRYPKNWKRDREVHEVTAAGLPAPGPRLLAGRLCCPGAAGLIDSDLNGPPITEGPETDEAIVERHRRERLINALAMRVLEGLRRDRSSTRGRPSRGDTPSTYAITVGCPAPFGQVNCPLMRSLDGSEATDVPDVPNPPTHLPPHLLPRACTQNAVTYHLDETQIKMIQYLTLGSHQHIDFHETMRSANERYHSQLKHSSSGGMNMTVEIRGIAAHALIFAIRTAITNRQLINDFPTKHLDEKGRPTFGPREELRRHRQDVIDAGRKARNQQGNTSEAGSSPAD